METRRKKGKKPRLLYTESDLLVRSIRDLLTSDVSRVVIDSEPALKRVGRFVKIAAPRSGAKLSHYTGTMPIFHAFGIETQINAIHAREVMLPSGGRLVIDQTEALVAIGPATNLGALACNLDALSCELDHLASTAGSGYHR